jgi:hypothetical protein
MLTWVPLVSISRMYLGRHFLGDVFGGRRSGRYHSGHRDRRSRSFSPRRSRDRAARGATYRLTAAALAAVGAFGFACQGAYDAGKLLGVATGTFFLVRSGVTILADGLCKPAA